MHILPFYSGVRSYIRSNIIYFINQDKRTWAAMPESWVKFLADSNSKRYREIHDALSESEIFISIPPKRKVKPPVKPLLVTLTTTGKCNLRCLYCFNSMSIRNKSMTPDILRDAVNYAFSNPYAKNGISFSIYGGEPLMERGLLYEAVRLIRDRDKDFSASIEVVTNGTLLTDEDIEFFSRHNVIVTMSFDGLPIFQNKNRPDALGNPCAERVLNSAELLKKHGYMSRSNVLCTVTHEMTEYLCDIADFLQDKGFNAVEFLPVRRIGQAENHEELLSDSEAYVKSFIKLIDSIKAGRITRLKIRSVLRMIMPLLTGQTVHGELSGHRCGAGRNSIVIGYDGSIRGCDMLPDSVSPVIGDIWNGINELDKLDELISSDVQFSSQCKKCPWRCFCNNSCPGESASDCGSCRSPHVLTCALNRTAYPYMLESIVTGNGELQRYFNLHTKQGASQHENC